MSPRRIQRKRTKGWRMPEGAVYVGRGSRWGNPFAVVGGTVIGPAWFDVKDRTLDRAVRTTDAPMVYSNHSPASGAVEHAAWLFATLARVRRRDLPGVEVDAWIIPLRDHDLACWCPLEDAKGNRVPCHADVLLELANPGLVIP